MRLATLTMLIALAAACGKTPPEEVALASPLLSGDTDRQWILARASRVGDGRECKERYLQPDDHRYQELTQKCDFWSRNYADYLRINGYPTVEYPHLQDPLYWRWFSAKRERILDCKDRHASPPVGTSREQRNEVRRLRNQCDPYDDALQNQELSPTDLGVRYP